MGKRTGVFVLLILFCTSVAAQSLKLSAGGGFNFLLSKFSKDLPDASNEYNIEMPSVAEYYKNNFSYLLDLSYKTGLDSSRIANLLVGIGFEKGRKEAENNLEVYELGSTMEQLRYTPYLGFGWYINSTSFIYALVGGTIGIYDGKGRLPVSVDQNIFIADAEYNFSRSLAVRMGGGVDAERIKGTPVSAGVRAYLELGTFKRKNIEIYHQGTKLNDLTIKNEKKFYDNLFAVVVTVGYQFDFH